MLPTTSSLLLDGLLAPEGEATWREFDARYRPVLFAFARRLALSDEDAREVAQDTLAAFVEEYRAGKYDRRRGRLRAWLFAMARSRVARLRRAQAQRPERGGSVLNELPAGDELGSIWEQEWRHALLLEGLRLLREKSRMDERTLHVFEALTLGERCAVEVAAELGMTVNAVHQARFRAMERLSEIVRRLEKDW